MTLQHIGTLFDGYLQKKSVEKKPPHELAGSVDLIVAEVGLTKRFTYGYWLRLVKKSGFNYWEINDLCKRSRDLSAKYNKGGFFTNALLGKNGKNNNAITSKSV